MYFHTSFSTYLFYLFILPIYSACLLYLPVYILVTCAHIYNEIAHSMHTGSVYKCKIYQKVLNEMPSYAFLLHFYCLQCLNSYVLCLTYSLCTLYVFSMSYVLSMSYVIGCRGTVCPCRPFAVAIKTCSSLWGKHLSKRDSSSQNKRLEDTSLVKYTRSLLLHNKNHFSKIKKKICSHIYL